MSVADFDCPLPTSSVRYRFRLSAADVERPLPTLSVRYRLRASAADVERPLPTLSVRCRFRLSATDFDCPPPIPIVRRRFPLTLSILWTLTESESLSVRNDIISKIEYYFGLSGKNGNSLLSSLFDGLRPSSQISKASAVLILAASSFP